jgi:hypothetical protein
MTSLFLLGGGEAAEGRPATYGRFVQAATTTTGCRMLLIVAEEQETDFDATYAAYHAIFESVGTPPDSMTGLYVSPERPLTLAAVEIHQPTGVFVCGGMTPLYQEDTLLHVEDDALAVHGLGHAYHVRRNEQGQPTLAIFTAGQRILPTR